MNENFEAVVYGCAGGIWTIVARKPVAELAEGLTWGQAHVVSTQISGGFERLSTRVVSSFGGETAESVMKTLGHRAGAGLLRSRAVPCLDPLLIPGVFAKPRRR
jgi:hypothetical protein